jgi:cell filamentation protein
LVRGLPHLCAIHRQLYQDVFDWAGQLREVDIYQGDTRLLCLYRKRGNALMQDLEEEGYLSPQDKFIERLAHYYCEINVLHPFRLGNGMAHAFSLQLAIRAALDWRDIVDAWNQANQRRDGRPF